MNYIKDSLKRYVNSFKNKNILLVSALNALFLVISVALIKIVQLISKPYIEKVDQIDLSSIVYQSEAQLQTITSVLKGFAIFTVLTVILFLLLLIINWSFCQGMIYHIFSKRKFTFKYFEKFLLLNLIWFIPWLALSFVILFGTKIDYFVASFFTIILAFLHLSFVLYTLFVNHKLKKLIHLKIHFRISIVRIYHFIVPYTLITLTFLIISQLNLLNPHYLIIVLIYILFFSWLQSYTRDVIIKIKE